MKIPEHKFLYKGSAELPFVFYTAVNTLTATNIVIQPGASSDLTAAKEIHITGESHLQGETHIFTSPSFIDCNDAELDDFLMHGRKASIVQAEPAEIEKAKREIEVLFNKSKIANTISVFPENYRGVYCLSQIFIASFKTVGFIKFLTQKKLITFFKFNFNIYSKNHTQPFLIAITIISEVFLALVLWRRFFR